MIREINFNFVFPYYKHIMFVDKIFTIIRKKYEHSWLVWSVKNDMKKVELCISKKEAGRKCNNVQIYTAVSKHTLQTINFVKVYMQI